MRVVRPFLLISIVALGLCGLVYAISLWIRADFDNATWWSLGVIGYALGTWRDRAGLGLPSLIARKHDRAGD